MINTAIVFDHRGRATKGKEGPIEVRLTIDRKPYYINTGVRVRKEEWKLGRVMNRADALELNERVEIVLRKIEQEINECMKDGRAVDVAEIRRHMTEADAMAKDDAFLQWAENERQTMVVSAGTRAHYATLMMRLLQFNRIRSWSDLTVANIYEWDKWLHKLKKPQGDSLTDAAIYNYHKNLKKLVNVALTVGMIEKNPYDQLKGKFKRGDSDNVEYLTEDEMHAIENLQGLCSQDDKARDLFVVQMYTGLPYADLMAFDIEDYKEIGGKLVKRAERIKTGVPYVSQLLPPVLKILEKYGNQLPRISNEKMNESLKVVGRMAGIDTPLHSHLGRHTFATWMLSNGVPIEQVSKMLGHTNITQTQRYAKVLAKDIHASFLMVEKKMKKGRTPKSTPPKTNKQ